ncbi:hypothetical protein niasHT_007890 [Heterodera trifolii]|uniref:Uncharacterized protein n=1 Tax=Heterodera trifolii TaxID=157864 RepID=A0ABD2LZS5_9BILA
MFLKLCPLSSLLLLLLISFAIGYSPVGNAKSHPLKLRKRISYSDGGVMALNGAARKTRMPTRKMVEKPRMRFKGGSKLAPKHSAVTAQRQ